MRTTSPIRPERAVDTVSSLLVRCRAVQQPDTLPARASLSRGADSSDAAGRAKWRPPPIRTGRGRRVRGQYTLRGHSIRRCSMRKRTHRLPGLILSNHEFILPLDPKKPNAEKITAFPPEAVSVEHQKQ